MTYRHTLIKPIYELRRGETERLGKEKHKWSFNLKKKHSKHLLMTTIIIKFKI